MFAGKLEWIKAVGLLVFLLTEQCEVLFSQLSVKHGRKCRVRFIY